MTRPTQDKSVPTTPGLFNSRLFRTGHIIDDKWILMEMIGKGGMGEVYRAHQLNLKRDVAIKVISEEILQDQEENPDEVAMALGRFQREVQTMAQVRHPNVLQIFDYGSVEAERNHQRIPVEYIAMEYVPGNTLRFTMSEEGFEDEPAMLCDWIRDYYLPVLDGMEAIHDHGIVHRDVKPENILMDGDTPKIADFGLARSMKIQAVSNSWEVKGTWAYMAPEQFADFRKAGPQADIYALGKILFEAVIGKMDPKLVPFKPVAIEAPQTPLLEAINVIVCKATHELPDQRFADVSELRSAVLQALQEAELGTEPSAGQSVLSSRLALSQMQMRWLWVGIVAVIVAVAAMAIYHVWDGRQSRPESATIEKPNPVMSDGPLSPTWRGTDSREMVLLTGKSDGMPVYMDRTPVTFHHYLEFLNTVHKGLVVESGVVKSGDEIWIYLGDGSAPHEQILYEHGRFHIRDAAWAPKPVVRVTWLGARAYTKFHGRRLPSSQEWGRAAEAVQGDISTPQHEPSTDLHSHMMGTISNADTQKSVDPTNTDERPDTSLKVTIDPSLKEWVSDSASTAPVDEPISRVVDPTTVSSNKLPLRQYPWEGFADVGFRSVLDIEK